MYQLPRKCAGPSKTRRPCRPQGLGLVSVSLTRKHAVKCCVLTFKSLRDKGCSCIKAYSYALTFSHGRRLLTGPCGCAPSRIFLCHGFSTNVPTRDLAAFSYCVRSRMPYVCHKSKLIGHVTVGTCEQWKLSYFVRSWILLDCGTHCTRCWCRNRHILYIYVQLCDVSMCPNLWSAFKLISQSHKSIWSFTRSDALRACIFYVRCEVIVIFMWERAYACLWLWECECLN